MYDIGTYYIGLFLKKKKKGKGRKKSGQMVAYLKAESLNMIQLLNSPNSGLPLI